MNSITTHQLIPIKQKTQRVSIAASVFSKLRPSAKQSVSKRPAAETHGAYMRLCAYSLIALNLVLLGMHVVHANTYAVTGYQITEMRNNINKLTEDNKKLTLQLAEGTSIVQVEQSMAAAHFVPVTTTEFIKRTPTQVTQR